MERKYIDTKIAGSYLKEILKDVDSMSEQEAKGELKKVCNYYSKLFDSLPSIEISGKRGKEGNK